MKRSPLLVLFAAALVAAVGLAYATRAVWRPEPKLALVARADAPGFRDLVIGPATAGAVPATVGPGPETVVPATEDLCTALFGDPDAPRIGTGDTIAVYFTDYRCPYCRVLGALLIERAERGEITLIVREWPILGPASQAAARTALAAARQGAFLPAYERLMGAAFVPTPAYVRDLATDLRIDPARVAADIGDPAMEAHLARNVALAETLGFRGTPGLVVGRTVARRSVREPVLDALIRAEDRLGPPPC